MSRVEYDEDSDAGYNLRQGRWLAIMRSTLLGRRGQEALRLLQEELERMPVKELTYGRLCDVTEHGPIVCALGALAHAHGYTYEDMKDTDIDIEDDTATWAAGHLDISYPLAMVLLELNDEEFGMFGLRGYLPSERYQGVLDWVRRARAEPLEVWREYKRSHYE